MNPQTNEEKIAVKFDDKTQDEKINILRNELRDLKYVIKRVYDVESQLRAFENHKHMPDGETVLSFGNVPKNYGLGGGSLCGTFDRLA